MVTFALVANLAPSRHRVENVANIWCLIHCTSSARVTSVKSPKGGSLTSRDQGPKISIPGSDKKVLRWQCHLLNCFFLHRVFLMLQWHSIKSRLPSIGNENIEFLGKEANRQMNCPIQTVFAPVRQGGFTSIRSGTFKEPWKWQTASASWFLSSSGGGRPMNNEVSRLCGT